MPTIAPYEHPADPTASTPGPPRPGARGAGGSLVTRHFPLSTLAQDRIYCGVLFVASLSILVLVVAIALELVLASRESLHRFGGSFFVRTAWDPVHQDFGALAFILGTLYTSFWALIIAVPIGMGAAIFLAELAPRWIRTPVSFLIELLAAIPSVVYGLWGIFALSPWLVQHVETP